MSYRVFKNLLRLSALFSSLQSTVTQALSGSPQRNPEQTCNLMFINYLIGMPGNMIIKAIILKQIFILIYWFGQSKVIQYFNVKYHMYGLRGFI